MEREARSGWRKQEEGWREGCTFGLSRMKPIKRSTGSRSCCCCCCLPLCRYCIAEGRGGAWVQHGLIPGDPTVCTVCFSHPLTPPILSTRPLSPFSLSLPVLVLALGTRGYKPFPRGQAPRKPPPRSGLGVSIRTKYGDWGIWGRKKPGNKIEGDGGHARAVACSMSVCPLLQQLDWIRLEKMEGASQSNPQKLGVAPSRPSVPGSNLCAYPERSVARRSVDH